ncbi:hypothetical protein F2Q70_00020286 [Brassica cretica]|uniref:Uncharacterized protein n=1 Tax=Brassica cretica TaxID=69181 RepID=A0A8S9HIM7_BRACR|nr:hypothetical protein F2Q70_00020286 [Brassica cretica]KAF2559131.1 hypothetical protein F2Q68_00013828 [Brassica cretica]
MGSVKVNRERRRGEGGREVTEVDGYPQTDGETIRDLRWIPVQRDGRADFGKVTWY